MDARVGTGNMSLSSPILHQLQVDWLAHLLMAEPVTPCLRTMPKLILLPPARAP